MFDLILTRWLLVIVVFCDLSLGSELPPGKEGPTVITVLGQIVNPGPYKMSSGANLLDAIFAAGGFSDLGSRYVVITSKTKENAEYELHFEAVSETVSFSIRGESDEKRLLPTLKNGDIITIKEDTFMTRPWQLWSRLRAKKWRAEHPVAGQPTTNPEHNPPAEGQLSPTIRKVVPR
jgi:hypothetical protein